MLSPCSSREVLCCHLFVSNRQILNLIVILLEENVVFVTREYRWLIERKNTGISALLWISWTTLCAGILILEFSSTYSKFVDDEGIALLEILMSCAGMHHHSMNKTSRSIKRGLMFFYPYVSVST